MASRHTRPFRVVGLIAAGLFSILFLMRMDVLELLLSGPKSLSAGALSAAGGRESWMSIHRNRRIGYSHTRLSPQAGGYELRESVLMVNTMGMVQDLTRTRADLLADLSLENFDFEIASGQFRFAAEAVSGEMLRVQTEAAGDQRTLEIPLKKKPYLTAAVIHALSSPELERRRPLHL